QRWSLSDLNPWLAWLGPAAETVKAQRQPLAADDPARKVEKVLAELTSASLDYYRAVRDALSEAAFFQLYGTRFSLYMPELQARAPPAAAEPRELPVVREALGSIAQGGYPQALARVAVLLARKGEPLPLSRIELKQELMNDYREFIPQVPRDEARRTRGEQAIIVRYEPEKAIEALPALLAEPADRERLLTFIDRLLADRRLHALEPSAEQTAMLARIRTVLGAAAAQPPKPGKRPRVPTM